MTIDGTATDGPYMIVPVQVGNAAPILALVDTGSYGLRVLSSAVPESALTALTDVPVTATFHSGGVVNGVVATAPVTIGGMTTENPIPIEWVESFGCTSSQPDCPNKGATLDTYSFSGSSTRTQAILGLGMRSSDPSPGSGLIIGNPIAQMPGHPAFAIKAPAYGSFPTVGTLAIAPSDTSSFAQYGLPSVPGGLSDGTPNWNDFAIPACVNDQTTPALSFCGPSVFDTGGAVTQIELTAPPDVPDAGHEKSNSTTFTSIAWAPNTDVSFVVGESSDPIAHYSLVISKSPANGRDAIVTEPAYASQPLINLGTMIFFRFDVLFDQEHGIVGLAPKG
jgi:hypothetical protein